jgi:methylase of polypeptide subunit release factors
MDIYSLLFGNIRYKVKNVFECGLGSADERIVSNMSATGSPGASLRIWKDYFPNALIWGADIDKKALFEEDRIKTGFIDQLSPTLIKEFFQKVGGQKFDIIIDDGLHTYEAGLTLFENAIDNLASDGIYIIEDISNEAMEKFSDYFHKTKFVVDYIAMNAVIDRDDAYKQYEYGGNALLVIRKNVELLRK